MKKYGKLFCTFAVKDSFMKLKVLFIMNPISGTTSKDGIAPLIDKYIDSSKFDCQIRVTEYAVMPSNWQGRLSLMGLMSAWLLVAMGPSMR